MQDRFVKQGKFECPFCSMMWKILISLAADNHHKRSSGIKLSKRVVIAYKVDQYHLGGRRVYGGSKKISPFDMHMIHMLHIRHTSATHPGILSGQRI